MKNELDMSSNDSQQPLSRVERTIAALWSEVLQTAEPTDPSDDFFAAGGNSMAMVMLEYRIQEEFSIELPSGVLLSAPTLRELSVLVDAECRASRESDTFPSEARGAQ